MTEVGNITKAATFKIFLHLKLENTEYFFVTVLFNTFMRQALTDDFWGLHKNLNHTFPLKLFYTQSIKNDKFFSNKSSIYCIMRQQ